MKKLIMLVILVAAWAACDECKTNDTRCHGQVAEICSSGGQWETLTDCTTIEGGGTWTCCESADGGPNCLPVDECRGDR